MPLTEVHTTTRLPPAGRCIYCGSTERLSDEHVIPYALGGNLILPESTCESCSAITSEFERKVLRGFMLRARDTAGFPTRRLKDRSTHHTVTLIDGSSPREVTLPIGEDCAFLHLPLLESPRFLRGEQPIRGVSAVGHETIVFGKDPVVLLSEHGASGLRQTDDWDLTAFARMLAKTGYSYFVGIGGFVPMTEVPVLPLIRGDSDDGSHWVGSAAFQTQSEQRGALHALTCIGYEPTDSVGPRLVVARVKLFASAGATGYEVIVHIAGRHAA